MEKKPKMAMKKTVVKKTVVKPAKSKPIKKVSSTTKVVSKVDKPVRTLSLPEVSVTATRLKRAPEEMVRLSPFGEAKKSSVDSLKRVGYGKSIGEPYRRSANERETYGASPSDLIKKALKLPQTKKKN
jgi:hypothetical protein